MLHPHGYYGYLLHQTLSVTQDPYEPQDSTNSTTKYPVLCYCENYGLCSCDDFPGNGTSLNTTLAIINGTRYSLLHGTLANGTTAPDSDSGASSLTKPFSWISVTIIVVIGSYRLA